MVGKETWTRLPRVVRGGLLIGLGAGATFAAMTNADGGGDLPKAAPAEHASFPVGVGCAEKPSGIVTTQALGTYTFRCINPDGNFGKVTALGELTQNHTDPPAGYDMVVPIDSPDAASTTEVIVFDFKGNDGQAVIGKRVEVGPTLNSDRLNGILTSSNLKSEAIVRLGALTEGGVG